MRILQLISTIVLLFLGTSSFAFTPEHPHSRTKETHSSRAELNSKTKETHSSRAEPRHSLIFFPRIPSPVEARVQQENEVLPNFFAVTFYKPTYILPYYYTRRPYNSVYENNTPNNESIMRSEIKYQLSFKVPVWKFCSYPTTIYLAYSQLSYWQAYNHTAFFRETDYEPEIFIANQINWQIFRNWYFNFLNIGAEHQSNGHGGNLERSWNRLYLEAVTSTDHWVFSIRPWYIFHDTSWRVHNKDIGHYLGYGEFLVIYKNFGQVLTLQTHNIIGSGTKRATAELTWSFPLTNHINGFLDVFSGYGQSLIEYDHRTNSAGIGIALSNWV